MVLGLVVLLIALTVYLHARAAAHQPSTVRVQDLTVSLAARPNTGSSRWLDADVTVDGPLGDAADVTVTGSMPAMSHMPARLVRQTSDAVGRYHATFELSMGGLWQVEVNIQRPNQPTAVARFDVRT